MTKEIHDINTKAVDFVVELIDYIFEYPDDDYMTMECLCRKLVKYKLMKKIDGYYIADRKTEPQTNKDFEVTYTCSFTDCDNFKNFGFGEKCIECKRKQSEVKHKDEPQTDGILFKGNLKEGDYKLIKTTNGWVLEGNDIAYCGEPQTERSSE